MTEAIKEKASARKVLAILIGLLATFLALEGLASVKPGGFEAFAQAASPTPGVPAIELINPDTTTSTEISARSDGTDNSYHLVAWVSNPPTGAVVQFKYTPSGTNQPTFSIICSDTGTQNARQATPDTYECDWDLTGIADGSGTLRAELYSSSGGKIGEDSEPVDIDSAGQTVELVYPTQGGAVGFYTGPDGIASGMIDVSTSGANADDDGTMEVDVYYSMSAPGAEPAFELCGSDTTTGGSQDSIRCDVAEDDPDTAENEGDPSRITAIAAVAAENGDIPADPVTGTDPDRDPDAADAHRAFGYEQNPDTVLVSPQTQTAAAGACSQVITAEFLDSNGRRIVGLNVDVHAAGPTDNLFFDDDEASTNSSRHKQPENHPTQPSANCEDTTPPPNFEDLQGFHARVDADLKHVESIVTSTNANSVGTDENGRFRFQLYSVDSGATQFTVWGDEDDDDIYCTQEAAGIGSIGWDQAAPAPTGAEQAQPCPTPTSTATGTPTGTPTTTPTGTPPPAECADGQDNDGDGATDTEDPDCESPEDDSESPQGNVVTSGPCEGFEEGSRQPQSGGGEIIVGTQGPDDLTGTNGDDLICGLGGRDSLRGLDGDDRLYGGGGNDDIRGTAGNDSMFGGNGLDVMRGGSGNDLAKGQGLDDTIRGFTGRDRLIGGRANDTLRAGGGNDYLAGNAGDDILGGGTGRDTCRPGPGKDITSSCER